MSYITRPSGSRTCTACTNPFDEIQEKECLYAFHAKAFFVVRRLTLSISYGSPGGGTPMVMPQTAREFQRRRAPRASGVRVSHGISPERFHLKLFFSSFRGCGEQYQRYCRKEREGMIGKSSRFSDGRGETTEQGISAVSPLIQRLAGEGGRENVLGLGGRLTLGRNDPRLPCGCRCPAPPVILVPRLGIEITQLLPGLGP